MNVRRPQLLIDGENICRRKTCGIKHGHAGLDGTDWRKAERDGIRSDSVIGRAGIKGVERQLANKEILRESVIIHAPAGADNGLAVAMRVPGNAGARREVVQVAGIQLLDRVHVSGRINQAETVLLFPNHAKIFPAQAVTQSYALGKAERVLKIKRVIIFKRLAGRVALCLPAAGRRACDESCKVIKAKLAAIATVKEYIHKGAPEFITELPVVLA